MSGYLAVLNAGSSSIKFALYGATADLPLAYRGQVERIGGAARLKVLDAGKATVVEREPGKLNHAAATQEIVKTVRELIGQAPIHAVGHRVVHGGMHYSAPTRVGTRVLQRLETLIPLAPLHQPHNLAPIRAIAQAAPGVPQVACFDTAFHRSQPLLAQSFALPRQFTDEGVRRYGFHGLSYEFIAARLRDVDPKLAAGRVIVAHLGNGASLCAMNAGKSVASTMGFTAVDGLMMGTRTGALDPGVILYLMDQHGLDARGVETLIYSKSGLLGVSGISADMRTLRQSKEPHAREAIDLFVYRIAREIGSLAASLDGLDGIVFTGGIGENDAATRAEIAARCRWLGLEIDAARNSAADMRIASSTSRIAALVIPTDEEKMIAAHTRLLLETRTDAA
jgi:acetate kinase